MDAPLQEERLWPWPLGVTLITGSVVFFVIARRCLALRAARRDEVDIRYRTVPSVPQDDQGLELHGRE
jgi:hypothetical protein